MKAGRFFALLVLPALGDFFVPYLFLRDMTTFLGCFLFWSLLTPAVIVFACFHTRSWNRMP